MRPIDLTTLALAEVKETLARLAGSDPGQRACRDLPLLPALSGARAEAEGELKRLQKIFGDRLYIELSRTGVAPEREIESSLIELAYQFNIPLVATNDAYFIDEEMYEAHDAFICIAEGSYVGEEKRRRLTPNHRLKTPAEMAALFADIPEAVSNTVQFARRCSFMTAGKKPMLPTFAADEAEMLRAESRAGLEERLAKYVFTDEMSEEARAAKAAPWGTRSAAARSALMRSRSASASRAIARCMDSGISTSLISTTCTSTSRS